MARKPVRLVLDFDGTLTVQDTLHLVAEAGYQRQKLAADTKEPPSWQGIVDAYLSDYKHHADTYRPNKSPRTKLVDEVAWLDSLATVEKTSADRVRDAGIFDHVDMQDMEHAAEQALKNDRLQLRPGWAEMLTAVRDHNSNARVRAADGDSLLQVISVNWSRWFIWSALRAAADAIKDHASSEQAKNALRATAIFANEIDFIISETESSTNSRPLPLGGARTLRTASDKANLLLFPPSQKTSTTFTTSQEPLIQTVYVGDSTTDLACLVAADVGICIRDWSEIGSGQRELVAVCDRLGILLKPLSEHTDAAACLSMSGGGTNRSHTLYYIHNFHEVVQWLSHQTRQASP